MKIEEEVFDALKSIIEEKTTPVNNTEEIWVILYRGHQIEMSSGRRVWTKKRYAQTALAQQISTKFASYLAGVHRYTYYIKRKQVYKEVMQQLIDDGTIEYKRIQ